MLKSSLSCKNPLRGVGENARRFFRSAYPGMQSVDAVGEIAAHAGYEMMSTHTLPRRAWF